MSLEPSSDSYTVCIESGAVRDLPLEALDQARRRMAAQAAEEPGLRQPALFLNQATGAIVAIFQTEARDFAQVAQIAVGLFNHVLSAGPDEAPPVQTLFIEHGRGEGERPVLAPPGPQEGADGPAASPRGPAGEPR